LTAIAIAACSEIVGVRELPGRPDQGPDAAGPDTSATQDATDAQPSDSYAVLDALDASSGDTSDDMYGPDTPTEVPPPDSGPTDAAANQDAEANGGCDSAACACKDDLSNIGTADFHIAFTMSTTLAGTAALANQRSLCSPGVWWDIRLTSGAVSIEMDDGKSLAMLSSTGKTVNDGQAHDIAVMRVAGTVTISIDGASAGSLAAVASFTQLPPVKLKTDVCDGTGGQVAFTGLIRGFCARSP
jgi:hypothetical protein